MRLFNTLAAVAALAVSSSAFAADLPSTAAPAPVAPAFTAPVAKPSSSFSWSGFYAGVNGGFAVDDSDVTLFNHNSNFYQSLEKAGLGRDNDSAKFTGGGQFGYAYQLGDFVLGAEADINYLNADRKYVSATDGIDVQAKTQYFGTVRPTFGYVITDNLLAYGTAGFAYGKAKFDAEIQGRDGGDSDMRYGWAVGAGAKYAITDSIFVKGEYLYTDLGNKTYAVVDDAGNGVWAKDEAAFHTFRAGVDYKLPLF